MAKVQISGSDWLGGGLIREDKRSYFDDLMLRMPPAVDFLDNRGPIPRDTGGCEVMHREVKQ